MVGEQAEVVRMSFGLAANFDVGTAQSRCRKDHAEPPIRKLLAQWAFNVIFFTVVERCRTLIVHDYGTFFNVFRG